MTSPIVTNVKVARRYQEYALFNVLPEGTTLDDYPPDVRWLYQYPFRIDYNRKILEQLRDEINESRARANDKESRGGQVNTPCELRQSEVICTPWVKSK